MLDGVVVWLLFWTAEIARPCLADVTTHKQRRNEAIRERVFCVAAKLFLLSFHLELRRGDFYSGFFDSFFPVFLKRTSTFNYSTQHYFTTTDTPTIIWYVSSPS